MTGNPLEAYSYTGRERVGEVPNIPERLWLEKCRSRRKKSKSRLGVS